MVRYEISVQLDEYMIVLVVQRDPFDQGEALLHCDRTGLEFEVENERRRSERDPLEEGISSDRRLIE